MVLSKEYTWLTNFNPYTWGLLIPVEDTNDLADDVRNETIPVEKV